MITIISAILALGLTIGGFAIRKTGLAFLGAGFWLIIAVYGILNGTPWNITYLLGFMSIAGVIICTIDGAMILTKKEEKKEMEDDGLDPDIKELMADREAMYKEMDAVRGRPTIRQQRKGLLP